MFVSGVRLVCDVLGYQAQFASKFFAFVLQMNLEKYSFIVL